MSAAVAAAVTVAMAAVSPAQAGPPADANPYVIVLGIAQDGGAPQAGCRLACCSDRRDPSQRLGAACLAIVDPRTSQRWLIDATPDFPGQLRLLDEAAPPPESAAAPGIDGILLTHAHVGHYTGLMFLGREVIGARAVPVYAMPRMSSFLSDNGPWDQLVSLGNIALKRLAGGEPLSLSRDIAVTPLPVPHRDEYSETVGFRIDGPTRSVLYIPDIDKWQRWDRRVEDLIGAADAALLDGTFYDAGELPGRDMSEIPHPLIVESMQRFGAMEAPQRDKVFFIHLNHTNPALRPDSEARKAIQAAGFHVARQGQRIPL